MNKETNILRGELSSITLPAELSMGQFMLDRLLTYDDDRISMINGQTDERIRFSQILDSSRRLAVYLINQGLRNEDRVAICSENTIVFGIPVCATIFSGATICPLNPGYTRREFMHSLTISRPKYIFVTSSIVKLMMEIVRKLSWSPKLIMMDDSIVKGVPRMSHLIKSTDVPNPETFESCKVQGDEHILAILCSSGTTGLPKGVMLTDKNFLTITCQLIEEASRNSMGESISLGILPFFHAYAFVSMVNQLALGATSIVLQRFEPDQFLSTIQRYKIQNLMLVPPLMVFLAKSPLVENYDLSSIKRIWCGAAALSKKIQDAVYQRLNKPTIKQGYGLTETTLGVVKMPSNLNKPGSIGKLTPNTYGKVIPVDDEVSKEPLGPYKEGELCFKGDQIMKGYCGDEDSTASVIDEDGWLHSGDIGYYDEDGFFYIVDRLKELIKYKGYQVPPAELEGILITHPEIVDAAVVGIPDEISGELPFGFVVKKPGSTVTPTEIVEFVNARVSNQKRLRGGVKIVDAIPKTASGKILRRLLRDSFRSKL